MPIDFNVTVLLSTTLSLAAVGDRRPWRSRQQPIDNNNRACCRICSRRQIQTYMYLKTTRISTEEIVIHNIILVRVS